MKVNNEIYENQGHGWWVDDAAFGFSSLRLCLNPVRYGYFKRAIKGPVELGQRGSLNHD
ncbi:MAG TPA: hypothetical protein VIM14_12885 [Polyangia bacterium]